MVDLPQAVRERLIALADPVTRPREIDGSSEVPEAVPAPTAREWLQFAILREAPRMPQGRLVGMTTAPVAPVRALMICVKDTDKSFIIPTLLYL